MANLNLDPAEVTILLTGFSVAHKMLRGGSSVFDSLNKFALAVSVYNEGKLDSLALKLHQLSKDAINEQTNLPNL